MSNFLFSLSIIMMLTGIHRVDSEYVDPTTGKAVHINQVNSDGEEYGEWMRVIIIYVYVFLHT